MTQDEIIEMARQAGLVSTYKDYTDWVEAGPSGEEIVAFAKLVAEKEREACANVCEEFSKTPANMSQAWRNGCLESATEIRERGNYQKGQTD